MTLFNELDKNTIAEIFRKFDSGAIVQTRLLKGGSANVNYYLATQEKEYVLTICENKSFEETKILANLLRHLENQRFATTKLFQTKQRQIVSSFNDKPVLLKEFIRGDVKENLDGKCLYNLSVAIGRLHQISPPNDLPREYPYGHQTFCELYMNSDFSEHPFTQWLYEKYQYIKKHLHPDLPKSIIHGDIFPSNVIITKNEIPIMMDFEEACYYNRIFDIGMAIVGLCSENGKLNPSRTHEIIEGYERIVSLTVLEKETLKAFVIYAAVATAFWRFRQFHITISDENLRTSYREMKDLADQVFNLAATDVV